MYSMCTAEVIQVLDSHTSDVISCDFYEDYLATCSGDKSVRVWVRDSNGKFLETNFSPLLGHTYGVNCVRFSSYGNILASCSTDGKILFWNITDGGIIAEVRHESGSPIRVCAFSCTSTMFATGGDDEVIVLWDIGTKSVIKTLLGHESMVTALSFSPDGAFLASCSSAGDIMLWDARYTHGKCLASVANAHDLGILSCDFSSQYEAISEKGVLNGNYTLATCGNDDLVKIWSVLSNSIESISLVATFEGHTGNVMSCRFSNDGTILASTGGDQLINLWNVKTAQVLQTLKGHSRYVTCCAFSHSSLLATGSNDKTVVIWSLNNDKIVECASKHSAAELKSSAAPNHKRSFLSWTTSEVSDWLKMLKLEDLTDTFQEHSIDGKELMYLTSENLSAVMKIDSLGQRNKILRAIQCLKNPLWQYVLAGNVEESIPCEFCCPITHEVMRNPVVAADGYSYESSAIQEWLESGNNTSPMTNEALAHKHLTPNNILFQLINNTKLK